MDQWDRPIHKYEAPLPHRCHRCTTVARQQEASSKDAEHPHALVFTVIEKS